MKHEDIPAGSWHKATYSQLENACVEVGSASGVVGVRDTKLGVTSPVLVVGPAEWAAFVAGVKAGEFGHG